MIYFIFFRVSLAEDEVFLFAECDIFLADPGHSLIKSVSNFFSLTNLRSRHAQMVRDRSLSNKIDNVRVIKSFLNLEGHPNHISGSKVTAFY